jgi:uncharacterized protein
MPGKFELKKSSNGQYHFHLKATNGQVILASEQYKEKRGALRGIESVKKNAGVEGRFNRQAAKNGQHYFTLRASNGKTIGQSETYESTASLERGIESVKKNAPDAKVDDKTAA